MVNAHSLLCLMRCVCVNKTQVLIEISLCWSIAYPSLSEEKVYITLSVEYITSL